MSLKRYNLEKEIYFCEDYLSLYLNDSDTLFRFEYKEGNKYFKNISIKRAINKIGTTVIDDGFYDLESVYGYGGYLCNSDDKEFINRALDEYTKECERESIVAEFIRFHPFNHIYKEIDGFFDLFCFDRNVVTVDTSIEKEKRWEEYSSKVRNILRKCEKELVFKESSCVDTFIELYERTMQRNSADEFYFFDKSYFERLLLIDGVKLYEVLYEDRVISSSFFFLGESFAHYHLSANDYEYRKYNANYFILDSIFDIANKEGIDYFNLGGGRSNLEDDLLLKFKKKFSKKLDDFYIAGKVFNKDVYNKYNKIWEAKSKKDIRYFLKYRLEL